jgi:glycosyltransferase involved in cell wall biosynthesis
MDAICAIDLDTILPCYFISALRRLPRLYDAHELFCEMQEVVTRPGVYKMWKKVERFCVPRFRHGYTVNGLIAAEFKKMYGVEYAVVRNMPPLDPVTPPPPSIPLPTGRFILYQGAVNEGRCFETLIPAMQAVNAPLVICGEGNYIGRARDLVHQHRLEQKVLFKGSVHPAELKAVTRMAWAGITLFDRRGISNYYSLANRFFDYMHAAIPQLAVNYPAYREINNSCPIAVLIDEPGVEEIAEALNRLLDNTDLYHSLVENCKQARLRYNWQEEEKTLISLYQQIFD